MKPVAPKIDFKTAALERLCDEIAHLRLTPGAPLAQADLAARLGVSRQPVSHALEVLKREGLVVERGRRGVSVAPLEPQQILDLYELRAAVDGLAARRMAERRQDPAALAALDAALSGGQVAVDSGDRRQIARADMAFHMAIYRGAGNLELLRTAEAMAPHIQRAISAALALGYSASLSWDAHHAIAAAVRAGRAEEAAALAIQHCVEGGRSAADRLTEAADLRAEPAAAALRRTA